jgi:outer membrane protein assembly factor BamA
MRFWIPGWLGWLSWERLRPQPTRGMRHRACWLLFCAALAAPGSISAQLDSTSISAAVGRQSPQFIYRLIGVDIIGNRITKAFAITREMNFHVGDTVSAGRLLGVVRRNRELIYNTGLFNRVDIVPAMVGDSLTLLVTVAERWYILPEIVASLDDVSWPAFLRNWDFRRITYGVNLNWANFTGRNDRLAVLYTNGYTQSLGLRYDRPFLFPSVRIDGGLSMSYSRQAEVTLGMRQDTLIRVRGAVNTRTVSVAGFLSKRFTQNHFSRVTVGYLELGYQGPLDSLVLRNRFTPETYRTAAPGMSERMSSYDLSLFYDSRDIRAYPLRGMRAQLSTRLLGYDWFSTSRLTRFDARWFRYDPLPIRGFYLAYGGVLSAILGTRMPYQQKIYLSQLGLRGFEGYVLDGTSAGVARAELRYAIVPRRIFRISDDLPRQFRDSPFGIYTHVFVDTGVIRDDAEYSPTHPFKGKQLSSVGVGVDVLYLYDNVIRFEVLVNNYLNRAQPGWLLNFSLPLR